MNQPSINKGKETGEVLLLLSFYFILLPKPLFIVVFHDHIMPHHATIVLLLFTLDRTGEKKFYVFCILNVLLLNWNARLGGPRTGMHFLVFAFCDTQKQLSI